MDYVPLSKIKIPDKRGQKIADYLYNRFFELFATDEELTEFIATGGLVDKEPYVKRMKSSVDGVISYADYFELMEDIVKNMPKRFSKRKAKQTLSIIDFYMGPKLIEAANEEKRNKEVTTK